MSRGRAASTGRNGRRRPAGCRYRIAGRRRGAGHDADLLRAVEDLRAGVDFGHFNVAAYVRNLFDAYGVVSAGGYPFTVPAAIGGQGLPLLTASSIRPRTIGINISRTTAFADGLSAGEYEGMRLALGRAWTARMRRSRDLPVELIASRLPEEVRATLDWPTQAPEPGQAAF